MRSMSMVVSMRPSSLQSRQSLLNLGPSNSSRCWRVPKLAKLQNIFFRSSAVMTQSQTTELYKYAQNSETGKAINGWSRLQQHGLPCI